MSDHARHLRELFEKRNLLAWQACGEAADKIERLTAELAAEREKRQYFMDLASAHRDELEAKITKLREALEKVGASIEPIASLVAMTPDGFPDHDICPIRLGQARALADAFIAISAVLKETGGGDA